MKLWNQKTLDPTWELERNIDLLNCTMEDYSVKLKDPQASMEISPLLIKWGGNALKAITIIGTAFFAWDVGVMISKALSSYVNYLLKNKAYLEELKAKLKQASDEGLIDDEVLKNMIFGLHHVEIIYKAQEYLKVSTALAKLETMITGFDIQTPEKYNEAAIDEITKPMFHIFKDGKLSEMLNRDVFVKAGSSIFTNGWNGTKAMDAVNRSLTIAKNVNVLKMAATTFEKLSQEGKHRTSVINEAKAKGDEEKVVEQVEQAGKVLDIKPVEMTPVQQEKFKQDTKEAFRVIGEVTKLYTKESMAVVKSSIALAELILKTI